MARKLDRSRDFGSIQGDSQGRVYEQDGVFFSADGTEWADLKKRGKKEAAPVDDDQLAAQLREA